MIYYISHRENLGAGFVFVLLQMDEEAVLERLTKRHKGDERTINLLKVRFLKKVL